MQKEAWILLILWAAALIVLFRYFRKSNKRLAQMVFLCSQSIAWVYEFIQIKLHLVKFPYREFPFATDLSFSLHYMIFPTIGMLFILHYPQGRNKLRVMVHFLVFGLIIPTYSVVVERTTSLVEYLHWNWVIGFCSSIMMLVILRVVACWFQKGMVTEKAMK